VKQSGHLETMPYDMSKLPLSLFAYLTLSALQHNA
jgi:hypothetical protein